MSTGQSSLSSSLAFARAATVVDISDESNGVFGELSGPDTVLEAIQMQSQGDNVGKLDDPNTATALMALHSFFPQQQGVRTEILLLVENASATTIRVRWMDEQGHNNPLTSEWTIDPFSEWMQSSHPGHVFVFTAILHGEERILGAYRILAPLPSGSPHCILIEEEEQHHSLAAEGDSCFILESIFMDESHYDALVVAAALLDPVVGSSGGNLSSHKTIETLLTAVSNIQKDPNEKKYQSLRLSNGRVKKQIATSMGAMHMLHVLGFRRCQKTSDEKFILANYDSTCGSKPISNNSAEDAEDLFLAVPSDTSVNSETIAKAISLLHLLHHRASSDFVAELELTPPPWQAPVLVTSKHQKPWIRSMGTHFISPEERWERAERAAARRRGRGGARRPNPGQAPSSHGTWGR